MGLTSNNFNSKSYSHSPNIFIEKYVEPNGDHITVGNILTNKIVINNSSDYDLDSAFIIDDIIKEMRYKKGSLSINGLKPSLNETDLISKPVINLGTVKSQSTTTIFFDVYVDDIPFTFPMISYSKLIYSYYNDNELFFDVKYSNKVESFFTLPMLPKQIPQYVDNVEICNKSLGDNVKFNILISPNENLSDTMLKNYLHENLVFISAYLINKNKKSQIELFSTDDFLYIGDLIKSDSYEIIINAKLQKYLNELSDHIIVNNPSLEYSFYNNDNRLSTPVKPTYLYVNHAKLDNIVLTNKSDFSFNDELTITIKLNHQGTVPIENVIINNLLPKNFKYINNSSLIRYNDYLQTYLHYDENSNSIYIPYINLEENIEITLKVNVISMDKYDSHYVLNDLYLSYQYIKYPFDSENKYEFVSTKVIHNEKQSNKIEPQNNVISVEEEYSALDYFNDEYKGKENKDLMKSQLNQSYSNCDCNCNNCPPSNDFDCRADLLSTLCKKMISNCSCGCNKLDYEISFTNTGMVTAHNVLVSDILCGATFDKDSLWISTSISPHPKDFCGELPKIKILEVVPNETITIYFSTFVDECPKNNQVSNYANLFYYYYTDDCCHQPINTHGKSNLVVTDVGDNIESSLTINDSISAQITVNSELYFKIKITNISSKDLTDVVYTLDLSDDYANYIKYKPNTLTINGNTPPTDINPNIMPIEIGTIKRYGSVIIEFTEIGIRSTPYPIICIADGSYSYQSCNGEILTCSDMTNEACLSIIGPNVTINKYAYSYCGNDPECSVTPITSAEVCERITYKITISNHSNYTLENVNLDDVLSSNLSYVPGSLKINNKPVPFDFQCNLKLPNLQPNSNIVISFDVIVESLPNPPVIINTACVTYDYLINPIKCIRESGKICSDNSLDILYADLTEGATKLSNPSVVSKVDPANNFGTYTVTLKNTGNVDAINVKFVDKFPKGLTFVNNSVVVTGVDEKGNTVPLIVNSIPPGGPLNIENGITISKVPPLVTVYIKYGFSVNPDAPSTIENIGTFDYSYIVNGVTINKPNNHTSIDIISVICDILDLSQIVSPSHVCPNDTVLYTINISNLSSNTLSNVILQSTVPANTSFVKGSFTVGLNPLEPPITEEQLAQGVDIGSISPNPNNTSVVQYQVKLKPIALSPIINTVNAYYTNTTQSKVYTNTSDLYLAPDCPTLPSCKVVTINKEAYSYCDSQDVNCTPKLVDDASLGDRINYKITLNNTSSVTITDAVFNDILPQGVTFVDDSLKINGVTIPSGLIQDLPIGILAPNKDKIISFDVIVTSIPDTFNITNTSCVTYSAIACSTCSEEKETNCSSYRFDIKSPNLNDSLKKYVEKVGTVENITSPGSKIPYIVNFKNTGNSDALNVVFYDTIPNSSDYIPNSVTVTPSIPKVNIIEPTSTNPVLKINFDKISSNQSYTINFNTTLKPSFLFGNVYNQSVLNYSYISASTHKTISQSSLSNQVVTHVNAANIEINKDQSKNIADIFEPVIYTLTVKNTGNLIANNVFVTDELSPYLKYIPDTLKINDIPSSQNVNNGILLGYIQPNTIVTIEFQVLAPETPPSNPIENSAKVAYSYIPDPNTNKIISSYANSNIVSLDIIAADLLKIPPTKEVNTHIVSYDDPASSTGEYTVTLYNAGNTDALNVIVRDTLPNGMIFRPNSVTVVGTDVEGNKVPLVVESIPPGGPLNIVNGINIKSIAPTITVKTTFGFKVIVSHHTELVNTSFIDYEYFSGSNLIVKPNNPTNPTTIVVIENALNLSKTIYPTTICPGDTVLFSVDVQNLVTNPLNNIIFQDTLPSEVNFIPNSFIIDNKPFTIGDNPITSNDLAAGINIGSIPVGDSRLIQFLTAVTLSNTSNSISNTAVINYSNGTIPSKVYSDTTSATIPKGCPNPCCDPCCCNEPCDCYKNTLESCPIHYQPGVAHPCPHYGKSSCRPGRRALCRKYYNQ